MDWASCELSPGDGMGLLSAAVIDGFGVTVVGIACCAGPSLVVAVVSGTASVGVRTRSCTSWLSDGSVVVSRCTFVGDWYVESLACGGVPVWEISGVSE